MIHKQPSPLTSHVRVHFELPSCIWADRIYLVGDFNSWDCTATPMQQQRDGAWRATLDLPQNRRYEFRYWIDGNWRTDRSADGFCYNIHGKENSIIDTMIAPILPKLDPLVHSEDPAAGALLSTNRNIKTPAVAPASAVTVEYA